MLITLLIGIEDECIVLKASCPSSKAIINDKVCYCLQVTCEQ
nr:hypothetical protein [uncultured Mediterraneibacter sp.]